MRIRLIPLLALTAIPFVGIACTPTDRAETIGDTAAGRMATVDTQADEDTIRAISDRWNQMMAARDTIGMAQLYADDGMAMPPNTKAMKGPDEVRSGVAAFLNAAKDLSLNWETADIDVAQAGDMAFERGTYKMSMTGPRGTKIDDHGNYVTVWKKVDGQWKVAADMNSSEVPMP